MIANVNRKLPPLYMPSSGSIVSVKLRISSGFGKVVFIVLPSDNSLKSGQHLRQHLRVTLRRWIYQTSLHAQLRCCNLLLLKRSALCRLVFLLLLFLVVRLAKDRRKSRPLAYHRPYLQHFRSQRLNAQSCYRSCKVVQKSDKARPASGRSDGATARWSTRPEKVVKKLKQKLILLIG